MLPKNIKDSTTIYVGPCSLLAQQYPNQFFIQRIKRTSVEMFCNFLSTLIFLVFSLLFLQGGFFSYYYFLQIIKRTSVEFFLQLSLQHSFCLPFLKVDFFPFLIFFKIQLSKIKRPLHPYYYLQRRDFIAIR